MKKKSIMTMLLVCLLAISMFGSCSKKTDPDSNKTNSSLNNMSEQSNATGTNWTNISGATGDDYITGENGVEGSRPNNQSGGNGGKNDGSANITPKPTSGNNGNS